jgi:hypothetical protein
MLDYDGIGFAFFVFQNAGVIFTRVFCSMTAAVNWCLRRLTSALITT